VRDACSRLTFTPRTAPTVILPATELENFELQTNTIIVKGFSLVGTVTLENETLSVHSQEANDVSHSQKAYGIMVELSGASQADARQEFRWWWITMNWIR